MRPVWHRFIVAVHPRRLFVIDDFSTLSWSFFQSVLCERQQVVLNDGSMAVNFEHSYSDGMIWTRMLGEVKRFLTKAMAYKAEGRAAVFDSNA